MGRAGLNAEQRIKSVCVMPLIIWMEASQELGEARHSLHGHAPISKLPGLPGAKAWCCQMRGGVGTALENRPMPRLRRENPSPTTLSP